MTDQIQRAPQRLAYIDWMRGLACVLMFQTHCYDSWLSPEARNSALMAWSRLGGTLPAPLFIFLAGISVALVTEKMREKGIDRARSRSRRFCAVRRCMDSDCFFVCRSMRLVTPGRPRRICCAWTCSTFLAFP